MNLEIAMRIVNQLSSQVGDRSETANRLVAGQCLVDPELLVEIAEGLESKDIAIAGDCAEIMTLVAAKHPERVSPYVPSLIRLLNHKTTRVRWEATHSLAYIAEVSPQTITPILPKLSQMIQTDKSVIVRDYAVDAVAGYAATSKEAARAAFPILKAALDAQGGKQAGHALVGLANVATAEPAMAEDVRLLAQPYLEDKRGVVHKAARTAIKASE
jgi:HEAT repeat protein